MKDLLNAIKSALQADLTYVRDSDVYVTEDENLIPEGVKFPAVGLKDGTVGYVYEYQGAGPSADFVVTVIAYVELAKKEASIMGDTATGKKGVLDVIADVATSLGSKLLSGQANEARLVAESASELVTDEELAVQKKSVTVRYARYGTY